MHDRIRSEVEAAGMDWHEFKKLPIEPWQNWLGGALLIAMAAIIGGPSAYRLLTLEINGVAVYAGIGVGVLCFVLGLAIFWARELQKSRVVMVLQAIVAAVAGVVAFYSAVDPWARGVAVLVAAVTIADALGKLRKAAE